MIRPALVFSFSILLPTFAAAAAAQEQEPEPAAATGAADDAAVKEVEWLQDFAAAKKLAGEKKLDLLIDFTGSDWCGWCIKLDKEVFSQPEFQAEIGNHFVLVKLDYPRNKALVTEAIQKQNEQLKQDFGIEGYPTIFLTDAAGRPYAKSGYQEGGPAKYLEMVVGKRKSHSVTEAAFARAQAGKGVERAKALAEGLDGIDQELVSQFYAAEMQDIITLDADGKAGLKAKYEELAANAAAKKISRELQQSLNQLAQGGKWDEVTAECDKALAAHKGKKIVEQFATFFKGIALIEGKQDWDGALKLMEAAQAIAPDSELGQQIPMIRKNVERARDQQKGKEPGKENGKEGGK
jgi:thioredoxin-related protein